LGIPAIRSRTYKTMEKNPETGKIEMVEKKRSPVYLAGGLSDTI
jgi:hypothetical protein